MINVAICDDEKKVLDDIYMRIKEIFDYDDISANFFVTSESNKLLEKIKKDPFDIIFLDIDMPRFSGMDIGDFLCSNKIDTILVFVTSHDELVFESFKYHPFGFIRKNHFDEEIVPILKEACQNILKMSDIITVKSNGNLININAKNILYIEGQSNYVNFHVNDKEYKVRDTLINLEKKLPDDFIRVHKGFIVNLAFIFSLNKNEILLDNKEIIPVGRSYSEDVRVEILKYMR